MGGKTWPLVVPSQPVGKEKAPTTAFLWQETVDGAQAKGD